MCKDSLACKIEERVVKLERHKYAPELNKLHLETGEEISVPRCNLLTEAINYVIQNNLWQSFPFQDELVQAKTQ